jgi:hypothetical protein
LVRPATKRLQVGHGRIDGCVEIGILKGKLMDPIRADKPAIACWRAG